MNTIRITKAARYCLYALIIMSVINIMSNFMQINLMNSYFVNDEFTADVFSVLADKNDARIALINLVYSSVLLASYFIIGRWIYLSCKLNHLLGIKNLEYSTGWSVGWFFIPFANLFKPYQVLKEIYKASFKIEDWENEKVPASFFAWWASWIVGNGIANVSMRRDLALGENYSYQDLNVIAYLDISSDAVQVICAFFLLRILSIISINHQDVNIKLSYDQES